MQIAAVISGDIIAFTSLDDASKYQLEQAIKELFETLEKRFDTYGRLIKGDYLECVIPQPKYALRVALIIKTFIKSKEYSAKNNRYRYFEEYGIRLAIGHGELSRYDTERGIIDGEAIYMSGRMVNEESSHYKKRVNVKNTLQFVSASSDLNETFAALLALLEFILAKATRKQCEVAYHKLLGTTEEEISGLLGVSQSAVNQHSSSIGWNAIEKAVLHYESVMINVAPSAS